MLVSMNAIVTDVIVLCCMLQLRLILHIFQGLPSYYNYYKGDLFAQVLDFMISITITSMVTTPARSAGGTGSLAPINSGRSSVLSNKSKRLVDETVAIVDYYQKHCNQFYICVLFP